MRKQNIAVLVSGGGTNLQALIDAQNRGKLRSGKLALVISNNPDAFAVMRAKYAGIPAEVIPKKELGQEAFEEKLIERLEEEKIDIIVLAGFMCILSEKFTSRYPERIINVHPALIPSFCGKGYYGLKVHEEALKYGVKVTGATVHFVNEIPDGGKIIMQKAVNVEEGDSPETLQRRVMEQAEWQILPEAIEMIAKQLCESNA